jgi:hypothetical protein
MPSDNVFKRNFPIYAKMRNIINIHCLMTARSHPDAGPSRPLLSGSPVVTATGRTPMERPWRACRRSVRRGHMPFLRRTALRRSGKRGVLRSPKSLHSLRPVPPSPWSVCGAPPASRAHGAIVRAARGPEGCPGRMAPRPPRRRESQGRGPSANRRLTTRKISARTQSLGCNFSYHGFRGGYRTFR